MNEDYKNNWEMGSTLIRLRSLINLQLLEKVDNIESPYYSSVFIEVLIHLNFLLMEWEEQKLTPEINFTDDIIEYRPPKGDYYREIKSLIRFFRNAACHATSPKRKTKDDTQQIAFTYHYGSEEKTPIGMNNYCKYPDDIAALMGDHILYIRRHLLRVYEDIYSNMMLLDRFAAYKKLIEFRIEAGS